jgi:adhesin transport system membrane fusion protein
MKPNNDDLNNNLLLYCILVFSIVFIIWASFASLDESVVAEGQITPSSSTQFIQSLEGGILETFYVKEGDVVEKGQELVKLNDIRFNSSYEENRVKYSSLKIKLICLKAEEANEDELNFSSDLAKKYPDLVENESNSFYANRKELKSKLLTINNNMQIVKRQYESFKILEQDKVISRLELVKVEKEFNTLYGQLEDEKNRYYSDVKDQISLVKTEMQSLEESSYDYKDRLDRTLIKSPVYGVIKNIHISTVGAIVKSGEVMIEIVPLDDELLVEGKILPNEIAFIAPGQEVNISISAYDPSIYGTLKGNIKHISADTIIEKDQSGRSQSFYKVIVKSHNNSIHYKGRSLPIIPGMQASIHIITGKRTVLQYIFKPLIKAKLNAFQEK